MKSIFLKIAFSLLLLMPLVLLAQSPEVDLKDPVALATYFTTFIVYGVVWLFGKIPLIPNWILPIVAVIISAGLSWILKTQTATDLSYLESFLLGVASIALHQIQKQIREGDPT